MVGFAVLLILFTLTRVLWNYSSLKSISGPFLAGTTDLWRKWMQNSSSYGRRLAALHEKYGKVVRVGPNVVSVSDLTVVCQVPGIGRQWNRVSLSDLVDPIRGQESPQLAIDQFQHQSTRKAIERHLIIQQLGQCEGIVDKSKSRLLSALCRHQSLDITTTFQLFAVEFVTRVVVSSSIQCAHDTDARHESENWTSSPLAEYILMNSPKTKLRRKYVGDVNCMSSRDKYQPFARSYDYDQKEDIPLGLTGPHYHPSNQLPTIAIGAACVSRAFAMAFSFLSRQPTIMSKLRNEIETASYQGTLSDSPSWSQIDKLQYLKALLNESMRFASALPITLEKVVPEGGVVVDNHYIPGGTRLECHTEAMRSDRAVYGEDVEVFRPERWLTADLHKSQQMEQGLLALNLSRRLSPGMSVAWLELRRVAALIIIGFDLQLVADAQQPLHFDTLDDLPSILVNFTPRPDIYKYL